MALWYVSKSADGGTYLGVMAGGYFNLLLIMGLKVGAWALVERLLECRLRTKLKSDDFGSKKRRGARSTKSLSKPEEKLVSTRFINNKGLLTWRVSNRVESAYSSTFNSTLRTNVKVHYVKQVLPGRGETSDRRGRKRIKGRIIGWSCLPYISQKEAKNGRWSEDQPDGLGSITRAIRSNVEGG